MKTLISLLLTVAATSAMAAGAEPAATPYNPGQPLDIAEVVSVTSRDVSGDGQLRQQLVIGAS